MTTSLFHAPSRRAPATRAPHAGLVGLALALPLSIIAACSAEAPPDATTFAAPMQRYLAERGDLCLAKTRWPIDVTQHEVDVGGRNALQMPVLERLALVSSSVAEIEVDDEGQAQPTTHRMKVRRYALTDAGRRHYLPRPDGGAANAPEHDLCAAHLQLDRIVGWELQKTAAGAPRRAVVTYTYRVDAAPWTADAEAQQVFPVVAGLVRGAGSTRLQETFVATPSGWVAAELQQTAPQRADERATAPTGSQPPGS